jgi:tripartite-type tricarboxylate transporter receptor subunit TctC
MLLPALLATPCGAQGWPAKSIRILESLPAGVARDNRTRMVAQKLSAILNQQVFVENRPGAGGRFAGLAAVQSPPDGYTFIMVGNTEVIAKHVFDMPFDVIRDFEPISLIEVLPVALVVRPSLEVMSLSELVNYAKAHPGELTFGSTGTGQFLHLNGVLFSNITGTQLRHIPYLQGSPFADLLGGHIDMIIDALAPTIENIKAARLRALAVSSERRVPGLPEVRTFTESGWPSFDVHGAYGLAAPKGTPEIVIARMQAAISQVVQDPELRQQWESQGGKPTASTPVEFATRLQNDSERWGRIIRENRIGPDAPR